MYHHLIVTIILSCGPWCFSPCASLFFFFDALYKTSLHGTSKHASVVGTIKSLPGKKKNNKRNNNGYITECIGTEFGRTQPSGCTSLNAPIPRHVCHRPHPTKPLLFRGTSPTLRPLAAPALRDSWAVPVSLSLTTRTSGLALNGCDSAVHFRHPAHHARISCAAAIALIAAVVALTHDTDGLNVQSASEREVGLICNLVIKREARATRNALPCWFCGYRHIICCWCLWVGVCKCVSGCFSSAY